MGDQRSLAYTRGIFEKKSILFYSFLFCDRSLTLKTFLIQIDRPESKEVVAYFVGLYLCFKTRKRRSFLHCWHEQIC